MAPPLISVLLPVRDAASISEAVAQAVRGHVRNLGEVTIQVAPTGETGGAPEHKAHTNEHPHDEHHAHRHAEDEASDEEHTHGAAIHTHSH